MKTAVKIIFNEIQRFVLHLFTGSVQNFDPVIIERVMARGYHDAAVESVRPGYIGDGRRRGYMHGIRVGPGSDHAGYKGKFQHITGSSRVFTDYDPGLSLVGSSPADFKIRLIVRLTPAFLLAAIPAEKPSYFICLVRCK